MPEERTPRTYGVPRRFIQLNAPKALADAIEEYQDQQAALAGIRPSKIDIVMQVVLSGNPQIRKIYQRRLAEEKKQNARPSVPEHSRYQETRARQQLHEEVARAAAAAGGDQGSEDRSL